MSLTNIHKGCKFFICILIYQITSAIAVDIYKDSKSLANVTDFYKQPSHVSGRYTRENHNINQSCIIPSFPPNSAYEIINEPEAMYKPGDYVKIFSILKITCDRGYKLPPSARNTSNCINGRWNDFPSSCHRACPPLKSTKSMTVQCTYNNTISLDNCMHPIDGTTAYIKCNTFYEADGIQRNPTRLCKQGRWTPNLPECYAVCGLKSPKGQEDIINGTNANPGDYPWHVGVYTNTKEFRCGGSIIDQNIILSAAHCFTDYSGNVYPAEDYLIGAGKYYRQYDDDKDKFAQYSAVQKIFVPERFKSTSGLNGFDIAVVILKDSFTLTRGVLPVCIALNEEFQNMNYLTNNNGTVLGWGLTAEGEGLSDVLKELVIPSVSFQKCYDEVPVNFRQFIMFDKICGGYLDQGTSVCQGDSGGGLVYNLTNRYYVKGIVSTSPVSTESGVAQCNSHQYGLYTSVYHHIKFIRELITNYGWKENILLECGRDDCINEVSGNRMHNITVTRDDCTTEETEIRCRLPNFPENGEYSLPDKKCKYQPGNYVRIYSAITLTCAPGYLVSPANTTEYFCLPNGAWTSPAGACTRPCPSLISTVSTEIRCKLNGEYLSSCMNPIENTIAYITCQLSYEEPSIQQNPTRLCRNGSWDYSIPNCYPICGMTTPRGTVYIVGGIPDHYPWHVFVYNAEKKYLCVGSIINLGIVLSTAHCFTNVHGQAYPKENYLVAAGKYYRSYDDPEDSNAQYSQIRAIHIPEKFRASMTFYEADIAIIILSTPFKLTPYAQPVCIDLQTKLDLPDSSSKGTVLGWWENFDYLIDFTLPIIPHDKCFEEVPKQFKKFITYDKFCTGHLDDAATRECNGASGGALVLPNKNDQYYVKGIIIQYNYTEEGTEDSNLCTLMYTSIAKHVDFISELVTLNRVV